MWNGNPEYMSFLKTAYCSIQPPLWPRLITLCQRIGTWNVAGEFVKPKGIMLNSWWPKGVVIAVSVFFKSLIPILASSNSEHLCNRTILLYPGYTFVAVLMLNLQRQHVYLVYHLSSQPTQLAKHRVFCFQQFGFSSTQQVPVLPVWVSEWNVICQPNLVWLSFPFYSWFWLFRKYLFWDYE